ncbi:hypothetical protein [Nonomuraea sp. GTA35]|uniref:hypothetical protein n=1 Tax=Nonomuraea sp. GTA35 TaxID=1676746 RepID=UPI0035C087DF
MTSPEPLTSMELVARLRTHGVLVNGRFQLIGTSDAALVTWTLVPAAVALAARQDGGLVIAFADKERVEGDSSPTRTSSPSSSAPT